jgi:hypothetical protein
LVLNCGKGSRIVGRGRKSYMSLAQDNVLSEVLVGKQLTLEGDRQCPWGEPRFAFLSFVEI